MKKIACIIIALCIAGCTTPMTTLKNSKSEQVVTCGGSSTGALMGGVIGYHIQKSNDEDCVVNYEKQGFIVIDKSEE